MIAEDLPSPDAATILAGEPNIPEGGCLQFEQPHSVSDPTTNNILIELLGEGSMAAIDNSDRGLAEIKSIALELQSQVIQVPLSLPEVVVPLAPLAPEAAQEDTPVTEMTTITQALPTNMGAPSPENTAVPQRATASASESVPPVGRRSWTMGGGSVTLTRLIDDVERWTVPLTQSLAVFGTRARNDTRDAHWILTPEGGLVVELEVGAWLDAPTASRPFSRPRVNRALRPRLPDLEEGWVANMIEERLWVERRVGDTLFVKKDVKVVFTPRTSQGNR